MRNEAKGSTRMVANAERLCFVLGKQHSMPRRRILKVFNRYLLYGGEENSVEKIHRLLEEDHEVIRMPLDSREWVGEGSPTIFSQAWRTVYNPDSLRRFERAVAEHKPDLALFHNVFPVGSPSLYHGARRMGVPVIQYAHNYRPYCVAGTLYAKGRVITEPLRGNYWPEIYHGVWQRSVVKSAIMAVAMKLLIRSGWLDSVKAWVCVSEFMRDHFIEAGLPRERVHGLRHAWIPMPEPPPVTDGNYYLFLSRLVVEKGVEVLLRAWEKISRSLGARAPQLWIAGEGPLEDKVREAAAKNPNIKYCGMLSGQAKRDVISNCRAMLVPSVWWEPLGLVTCEAYDYTKPVLAATSGGLTETVVPGITGFLHEPGNMESLISDVLCMETLPAEHRLEMGRAGRRFLLEHFGVDQWKARLGAIIDGVMQ